MPDNDINSYTAGDYDFSYTSYGDWIEEKKYSSNEHIPNNPEYSLSDLLDFDEENSFSITLSRGCNITLKEDKENERIINGYIVRLKKLLIDNLCIAVIRIQVYPGIVFLVFPEALKECPESKGKVFTHYYDRQSIDELLCERYDNNKRKIRIDNERQFCNVSKIKCSYHISSDFDWEMQKKEEEHCYIITY